MKRFLILISLVLITATASAQYYYPDSKNPEMMRHAERHQPCRKEVILPQVNGYNIYKADLHTHSVYSDGQVLPKWRVYEAWLDGLDVMAVTEHIEYRPYEKIFFDYLKKYSDKEYKGGRSGVRQDCPMVDLNFAVRESEKEALKYDITIIPGTEITRNGTEVGHFNALFTTDNNLIYDPDHVQAIRNAKAQGALVMHNHPGWKRTDLDMTETEKVAYGEGLIDGVEVMNGAEFYPGIIDRVREGNLFIAANTDIHRTTANDYRLMGHERPMTFILAKDKSLASLKEALVEDRTIAYAYNTLCGAEQLLTDFFLASVKVKRVGEKTAMLTNLTSISYVLKRGNGNPVRLDPFSTITLGASRKTKSVKLQVLNMWIGVNTHPEIEIILE